MTLPNNNNNNYRLKFWFSAFVCSLLLLLGSLMSSCKPRQITTHTKEIQKDSVVYTVNYKKKDTLILVKGDTLRTQIPVHYLSEIPVITRSNRGNLSLS